MDENNKKDKELKEQDVKKQDNALTDDFMFEELNTLQDLVEGTKGMPGDLKEKLDQMIQRLDRMARLGHYSSEFDTISRYISTLSSIPWTEKTEDILDLEHARKMMNETHYGMDYVKDRVLEYLSTLILLKKRGRENFSRTPVLLFVGLQGVGKTTISRSIAKALGRKFLRVSMGGIGSTLELRGRSKSFPEAEPGQIVKALIKTGTKNPVLLLDEIEKASGEGGLRSDIMAVLLELLDPEQNFEFRDHYVDYPYDLSDVLFVCSANNTGTITTALMDRMEVIKMPSYTDQEKLVIARDYLLKGIMEETGLAEEELVIDPELWPGIVRPFGYDSGIRSLGRTLNGICRKVAKEIVEGKTDKVYLNAQNLKYYLPQ
jgi:ATP-dependent Lon protease